jgi:hypothetical protein
MRTSPIKYKLLLFAFVCIGLASSCSKENEAKDLFPIFFPTDLLFEDHQLGRFTHEIPSQPLKFGPATFELARSGSDWSGFAVSNRNYRDFVSSADGLDSTRFSVYTGTIPHAGGNYLVVKPAPEGSKITFDRPLAVEKMLIAPTTFLYQAALYGEVRTVGTIRYPTFATGARVLSVGRKDYVRVKISGFNGTQPTGEVYHYLADRLSVDGARNFTATDWLVADLTPLGKCTHLVLKLESTEITAGTGYIPPYFCIDGIRFTENVL